MAVTHNYVKEEQAMKIVEDYILEHLDKSDPKPDFHIYIVFKSYILGGCKFLISSSLYDGMYYEVTFNQESGDWYLDAYKKFENRCISSKWVEERLAKPIYAVPQ